MDIVRIGAGCSEIAPPEEIGAKAAILAGLALMQTSGSDPKPPPLCRFVWGKIRSFLAYASSVTVTFDAFTLPDGVSRGVVRASEDALPQDNTFQFVIWPGQSRVALGDFETEG